MRFSQIFTLALAGAASAQPESDIEARQQQKQLEYKVVVKRASTRSPSSPRICWFPAAS